MHYLIINNFPWWFPIFSEGYNSGAKYAANSPTLIYLTKEAFIKDNMRIDDFNDVEYTEIVGELANMNQWLMVKLGARQFQKR